MGYEYHGYCYYFTPSFPESTWHGRVRVTPGSRPVYWNDFDFWNMFTMDIFSPDNVTEMDKQMANECIS